MRKQEVLKAVLFMTIGGCAVKAFQVIKDKRRQKVVDEYEQ